MNGKELTEKLNELNQTNKLTCTDAELEEYMNYGLLFQSNDKFMNRNGKVIDVDIIKSKVYKFSIDLSGLICKCEEIAQTDKVKRIYCMSENTYNKYKNQQLIITKGDIEYYRLFENELWRVVIL